ncbi:MAG: PQQ-binding-like beta-propeller repeat protein [Planctomycetota bacterium]|nr:PQQ-binding-like beta-propeller repeat protein [Planctomycetota bacterium]
MPRTRLHPSLDHLRGLDLLRGLVLLWGLGFPSILSAQILIATDEAVPLAEEARGPADGEGARQKKGWRGKRDLSPEYRSGAVPGEPAAMEARFERAEGHFDEKEWAPGLAVLDEILSEVTSPERRGRMRRRARQRQATLEKIIREQEARENAAGAGGGPAQVGGPGGAVPGGGGKRAQVGDDELTPTVRVYSADGILYRPVADAVRQRLLELPEEARQLYRRTYEDPARLALERAEKLPFAEGIEELERLAERYPITTGGRRALEQLAARLADSGRLAEASAIVERRLELPFEEGETKRAEVLALAVFYHLLAARNAAARQRLETIARDHPDAAIPVHGVATLGINLAEHDFIKRLKGIAEEIASPPSSWPSMHGSYHNGPSALTADDLPGLGSEARWIFRLKEPEDPSKKNTSRVYSGPYSALQAVTFGELLYFRHGDTIVALHLETGKRAWVADPGPFAAQQVSTYRFNTAQQNLDYSDLGSRALTVFRAEPGDRALVVAVDRTASVHFQRSGKAQYQPNRLVAYDALTGRLLWMLGARGEDDAASDYTLARGLSYTGPPTPAGRFLVAPATREAGYYLVGLRANAKRAAVHWVTRVYSFNAGYFQRYGSQVRHGSGLAAKDGVIYTAPGHGLVGAVEAASGRLLWLSRYRARTATRSYSVYGYGAHWIHSQPLVVERPGGDVLVVTPQNSGHLIAFDARSGRTLWEKRYSLGTAHVLGSDGERVFVAGSEVRGISLADGEEVWKSDSIGTAGGLGFMASGLAYVPSRGGRISVLDTENGDILHKFKLLDPRIPTKEPFNLFPLDGQLVALSPAAVVSIRPQEETWKLIDPDGDRLLFRRARLLRGSSRYAEALEIFYKLESTYRTATLHRKIVRDLLATVSEAVDASKDDRFITELLERQPSIVSSRSQITSWRVRQAGLREEKDPQRSMEIYADLLKEDGARATSPGGNVVDVSIYASDRLRDLLQAKGEEGAPPKHLADGLEKFDNLRRREALTEEALTRLPITRKLCQKIVTRFSHTPAAAKAGAYLAALESQAKRPRAAVNHLRRLQSDYPELDGIDEIETRIRALEDSALEDSALEDSALDGRGDGDPDPEGSPAPPVFRVPGEKGAGGGEKPGPWTRVFWHDIDEGIGVASSPGSEPLPAILTIHQQRLRAVDRQGNPFLDRELPDFPDVDEIKTRLQSHIEEPAVAHLAGGHLALFTAAGCYGFSLQRSEGQGIDSQSFRLLWAHTYSHPLEKVAPSRGFGSVSLSRTANIFPEVFFSAEGHPTVLMPDGEFFRLDRRTGKLIWRFPGGGYELVGRPGGQGPWYTVQSLAPPGIVRYPVGPGARRGRSAALERQPEFLEAPKGSRISSHVEGIATVHYGGKLTVLAEGSGRQLWTRTTASRLVFATPSAVWTTNSGNFKARSLRSGRQMRKIDLPENTAVVAYFRDLLAASDGGAGQRRLTLVTSVSSSTVNRYSSRTRTGAKLHLVRLDEDMNKVWEKKLADGATTYHGERLLLADGRWLFVYNEQEAESEKWYTRVVAVDPQSGESESWLRTEISGKGTGQPPRIAAVADGLMLGNADGFGWFRRSAASEEITDSEKLAGDPGDKRRGVEGTTEGESVEDAGKQE